MLVSFSPGAEGAPLGSISCRVVRVVVERVSVRNRGQELMRSWDKDDARPLTITRRVTLRFVGIFSAFRMFRVLSPGPNGVTLAFCGGYRRRKVVLSGLSLTEKLKRSTTTSIRCGSRAVVQYMQLYRLSYKLHHRYMRHPTCTDACLVSMAENSVERGTMEDAEPFVLKVCYVTQ